MKTARSILALILAASATPALAHTGQHSFTGFAAGFGHPFSGIDHILAMVSVGLFASMQGGRAMWSVPASFIAMMVVGSGLGMMGIEIPAAETGIAVSVVVLGALVASGRTWSSAAAMALAGAFAVFHGYAHGVEIPAGSGGLAYSAGFVMASVVLHILGLGAGVTVLRQGQAARLSGAAVTLAGLYLTLG